MKRKIKVLQVCAVDFTAKNLLLPLMLSLLEEGFEVSLACKAGKNYEFIKSQGIEFYDIPVARGYNPFKHLVSIVKLYYLIKRERFDIVHSHTTAASLDGCIAGFLARVPVNLYTIHGLHIMENQNLLERGFYHLVERIKCKLSSFVFTQSEEDRVYAVKNKIVGENKIITIGNGVDIQKFNPSIKEIYRNKIREEFNIPKDSFVLTIIARLSRIKGYEDLFKAVKLISNQVGDDFYLISVGDVGEDEPYPLNKNDLIDLLSDDSIKKRVIFTGVRNDVERILASSDVFILPSYLEGMPRSVIEAMASGLPVIASNIKGSREEVIDGETGILVKTGDIESLATAILKLYNNPKLRELMGRKGRERAEKYFDESKIIEKQLKVIRELLQKQNIK